MTEKLPKENQTQKKCLFIIYLLSLGVFIVIFTSYNSLQINDISPDVVFLSKPGHLESTDNPIRNNDIDSLQEPGEKSKISKSEEKSKAKFANSNNLVAIRRRKLKNKIKQISTTSPRPAPTKITKTTSTTTSATTSTATSTTASTTTSSTTMTTKMTTTTIITSTTKMKTTMPTLKPTLKPSIAASTENITTTTQKNITVEQTMMPLEEKFSVKVMEECKSNNLVGKLAYEKVTVASDFDLSEIGIKDDVAEKFNGDGFHPINCKVPKGKSVAIIFPFRDTALKGKFLSKLRVLCIGL